MKVKRVFHAQVVKHGGQRRGEVLGTQTVHDVLLLEGLVQQVHVLLLVRFVEFLPRLEGTRIARFKADQLVAVVHHAAVVHHHFQSRAEVDVHAAGGVGVAVRMTRFRAAGNSVVQSFVHRHALHRVQEHHFFVVDQLREAGAVLHRQSHFVHEAFRRAGMDTRGKVGVVQREFTLGFQEQVGKIVGRVFAVGSLAADGHGFPVRVAFLEFVARGVDVQVDELSHIHPHAFQKFAGLFTGHAAFFDVLLVVGVQVLVHAAVGNDGAGLLFDAGEHLHEPLALHRFAERAGGVRGHAFAHFGDGQKLGLALGIRFFGRKPAGQFHMAAGPDHDGVAHDDHGFIEGLLFPQVHGVRQIQGRQALLRFILDVDEAALNHLAVVRNPLQGGTVGGGFGHHELGLQAAFVVVRHAADLRGNDLVQMFMVGLAFPVGGDFFHDDLLVGIGNLEGALRAMVQIAQHFAVEVAVDFRIQNAVTAELAHAAGEKLIGGDVHRDLFGHVLQSLGPAQGQKLAFRGLHGFGEVLGALHVHMGNGELVAFENLVHALTAGAIDLLVDDAIFLGREAGAALGHGFLQKMYDG